MYVALRARTFFCARCAPYVLSVRSIPQAAINSAWVISGRCGMLVVEVYMGRYDVRPCPCGSGLDSEWQYDGYGIELDRTCEDCHDRVMARYRSDILDAYECDEPIEPEE